MSSASGLPRLLLALCLALTASCATSRAGSAEEVEYPERPATVQVIQLDEGQFRLDFEPLPADPALQAMQVEEARQVLAGFLQAFPEAAQLQVIPALASPAGTASASERRLRAEFLARYGPGRLPLPDSLQHSPLVMALKLSTRYMGPGVRDAAREMFRSPAFLASVALSVLVYFSAWVLPEPIFSKAFAATLTVRLAFVVGVLELRNVALACLQLYRDAQSAKTLKDLEAVAERFGRALGGVGLRVLVTVASFGVAKVLPNVPPGGLGPLLSPPRYAMAGGMSFQSVTTAHVVADGTIVIAGAAMGTAASALGSACGDGSLKKDGYQWHHLATNKSNSSTAQGGPWTPLFERIFSAAGMSLNDPANLVYLSTHQGPHPRSLSENPVGSASAIGRSVVEGGHEHRPDEGARAGGTAGGGSHREARAGGAADGGERAVCVAATVPAVAAGPGAVAAAVHEAGAGGEALGVFLRGLGRGAGLQPDS